jgi:signal transduction histidine kinase
MNNISFSPPIYVRKGLLNHNPILAIMLLAGVVALLFVSLMWGGWQLIFSVAFYVLMALLSLSIWYLVDWHPFSHFAITVEQGVLIFIHPESVAKKRLALNEIAKVELSRAICSISFSNAEGTLLLVYPGTAANIMTCENYLRQVLPQAEFIEG